MSCARKPMNYVFVVGGPSIGDGSSRASQNTWVPLPRCLPLMDIPMNFVIISDLPYTITAEYVACRLPSNAFET